MNRQGPFICLFNFGYLCLRMFSAMIINHEFIIDMYKHSYDSIDYVPYCVDVTYFSWLSDFGSCLSYTFFFSHGESHGFKPWSCFHIHFYLPMVFCPVYFVWNFSTTSQQPMWAEHSRLVDQSAQGLHFNSLYLVKIKTWTLIGQFKCTLSMNIQEEWKLFSWSHV